MERENKTMKNNNEELSQLFSLLGMMKEAEEKINESTITKTQKSAKEIAKMAKILFDAFVDEGFSVESSERIAVELLTKGANAQND